MKRSLICIFVVSIAGCASNPWSARNLQDEFTDQHSCRVVYGSEFQKGFVKGMGGIHYYPFVEKDNNGVIFGIHNDYNIPVGNVQIRIDGNRFIEILSSETPLKYSSKTLKVDLSYIKNTEGLDAKALQNSMDETMKNVQRMSSPYTATTGEKAEEIIGQLRKGKVLKMRIMGFGVNSAASTTGEYNLGAGFNEALSECGI